jgi:flagellar biosynthetic protein FliR
MIEALHRSLEIAPIGSPMALAEGVQAFVLLGANLFLLGLRFAAPVIAAMMIGNAALGVMARTVPQLNVLMVAFPLQIAIGLFTLGASLPLLARFFAAFHGQYEAVVGPTLQALAPAGGGF